MGCAAIRVGARPACAARQFGVSAVQAAALQGATGGAGKGAGHGDQPPAMPAPRGLRGLSTTRKHRIRYIMEKNSIGDKPGKTPRGTASAKRRAPPPAAWLAGPSYRRHAVRMTGGSAQPTAGGPHSRPRHESKPRAAGISPGSEWPLPPRRRTGRSPGVRGGRRKDALARRGWRHAGSGSGSRAGRSSASGSAGSRGSRGRTRWRSTSRAMARRCGMPPCSASQASAAAEVT